MLVTDTASYLSLEQSISVAEGINFTCLDCCVSSFGILSLMLLCLDLPASERPDILQLGSVGVPNLRNPGLMKKKALSSIDQTSPGKSKGMFSVGTYGLHSAPWLRYVEWKELFAVW